MSNYSCGECSKLKRGDTLVGSGRLQQARWGLSLYYLGFQGCWLQQGASRYGGTNQHMSRGGVMLYHVWGYRASIEQRSGRVVEGFSQVAEEADMDGYRVTM